MDVGVALPVEGDQAGLALLAEAAREAEHLGFHSIWATDRLMTPRQPPAGYPYSPARGAIAFRNDRNWLGPISVMGVVTGLTTTIKIGTNVLVLPYRHPIVLAQEIATLDWLSGGRIILGVGIGWMREEFDALGVDRRERAERTDEHICLMRQLWANTGPTSFHGKFTDFHNMALAAHSVRPAGPPIVIGGNSPAALARTARLGDGWAGVDVTPADAAATVKQLTELYEQQGRVTDGQIISVKRKLGAGSSKASSDPAAELLGVSVDDLAQELAEYRAAGISLVIYDLMTVPDYIPALRLIASEVMPEFRGVQQRNTDKSSSIDKPPYRAQARTDRGDQ